MSLRHCATKANVSLVKGPQSCLDDLRNVLGVSFLRTRFLHTFHQWKSMSPAA